MINDNNKNLVKYANLLDRKIGTSPALVFHVS